MHRCPKCELRYSGASCPRCAAAAAAGGGSTATGARTRARREQKAKKSADAPSDNPAAVRS